MSIIFLAVLVFCLGKNNWLIGITEGLCYHCHNHGNLDTCAINSKFGLSCVTVVDKRINDFISCLIENACNAKHENRP